ncbi:MAG: 5-3 exonuclease, partial [Anaeromyxobacteraceae bacterium]|nr:5-3 exonuclease [Anaeromyxobacteraceae bacterium]
VQVDRVRGREIDEEALRARRGVGPESIPDLLARHLHLESIPDDPALWPAGIRGATRLAGTLAAGREAATLYRRLATLVLDVPLAESLEDLRWQARSPV